MKKHIKVESAVIDKVSSKSLVLRTSLGLVKLINPKFVVKPKGKLCPGNEVEVHHILDKNGKINVVLDTLELEELSKEEIKEILKKSGIKLRN